MLTKVEKMSEKEKLETVKLKLEIFRNNYKLKLGIMLILKMWRITPFPLNYIKASQ